MTLPDTTPYDADRAAFSREALARLVLSSAATGVADAAMGLVVSRNDGDTGHGGRASQAARLVRDAECALTRAVVYERERGATWESIAHYLEIDPTAAEARFGPALADWHEAFAVPYRLDATGRKRVPRLPTAAYDPAHAVRRLDLWAYLYVVTQDRHAVSGGLPGYVLADDTDPWPASHRPDEIGGRVGADGVSPFLEQLAYYVGRGHHPVEGLDADTLAAALEATDDTSDPDSAAWHTRVFEGPSHTVRVRLARSVRADEVAVVVTGADSPELRLRLDTLLDVFAPLTG
ncbi:hypothetical protein [Streptomyces phaeolivaceus]|uniref:hypothetical protein n=1 Tax=Streptomyces phaeolivaceus TaxID=2653200 RepID=UPI001869F713|nr:hypothetical protein [Streptomyces phaeolivaceus]